MSFKYFLPEGELVINVQLPSGRKEYETENNSIIIIGANGSGKSRLGAWIEKQDGVAGNVHRVSGQRNLNFSENILLKQENLALNHFMFGEVRGSVNNVVRQLGPYLLWALDI